MRRKEKVDKCTTIRYEALSSQLYSNTILYYSLWREREKICGFNCALVPMGRPRDLPAFDNGTKLGIASKTLGLAERVTRKRRRLLLRLCIDYS